MTSISQTLKHLAALGMYPARQYLWDTFDILGDSRADAISSAILGQAHGTQANHWFSWVRAMSMHKYKLGLALGISGKTPDQYINANLSKALASKSGWLVFDKPLINAIMAVPNGGVFPYTNSNGVVVTATNVAQVSVGDIIAAATKALAIGKRVLITAEPGSTGVSQAMLNQVFLASDMLKAWCAVTPGAYFYDPRPRIWAATASTTALAFKPGFSSDGTHAFPLMAYTEAIDIKQMLDPVVLGNDSGPSHIAMLNSNYTRQLFANPLFNATSGGIRTTIAGTGNVPGGVTLSGAATTTCNITYAANANGLGNDVTFAFSASAADSSVKILLAQPALGLWSLNNYLTCGIDVDVAAGALNASVPYLTNAIGAVVSGSNVGASTYDMYSNVANWVSPAAAYPLRLRTPKTRPVDLLPGATAQWYTQFLLTPIFFGAGNITLTLRRPTFEAGLVYANGAFAG
jgi:hypothetical protein